MTIIKHFAPMLVLTIFALSVSANAQTPSIEVMTGDDSAQFSIEGRAQSVRVEVFAPSGERSN